MPESQIATSNEEAQIMTRRRTMLRKLSLVSIGVVFLLIAPGAIPAAAQRSAPRNPAEPAQGKPQPKLLARPAGGVAREAGGGKARRAVIAEVGGGGARLAPSSWEGWQRRTGC